MPSSTITHSVMAGSKRKASSVKDKHVQESKKLKIESTSKLVVRSSIKPQMNKKVQQSSDDNSEDSNSDGGAPLSFGGDSSAEEDEDEDQEEGGGSDSDPKAVDGLHPERANAVAANSQSSKEAHAKQKQLAQERKAAKPLAESLARTKKIWERLRRKSHVPLDERKKLVAELFEIITGRIKDYVLKHDSVRVVQTAIKYANPDQKRLIARELAGSYRQLAESRYAKFLIGKLLVQGDDDIRDIIVPEFFGHVRRLIKHPEASWILDDVYRGVATQQQKAIILREWYGAEFALFQKDNKEKVPADLVEVLKLDPSKRAPIMHSLYELINQLIQKKTTGFTLLHDAMLQYFLNAKQGTEEITDFMELIKGDEEGDLLKNLAFTKSGARVVCHTLAYGTAKDRKQILKTYKDTLEMMAADAHGHVVILTAYEVIDDTVLTSKSIFPELLSKDTEKQIENIVFSANDINARTTLLYLFQGRSRALFPASHSSDLEILAEIDKLRTTTSKKDPEIRRSELAKALAPYLLKAIETAASELVATSFGCQFITEVLFGAEGDKTAALQAVAQTAGGDPNYTAPEPMEGSEIIHPPSHIASAPYGGRMLKALIAGGHFDHKAKSVVPVVPALNFANILYPQIKEHLIEWATGSSSFTILALLEASHFDNKKDVLKMLEKKKNKLQKAATEESTGQKVRREAVGRERNVKNVKVKAKQAKSIKEVAVGNRGSALLLQMLE